MGKFQAKRSIRHFRDREVWQLFRRHDRHGLSGSTKRIAKHEGRTRSPREDTLMLTPEQKLILESLIDSSSLADVLESLSEIADGKAQHIAENWQDSALAAQWNRAASRIGTCAGSVPVQTVSIR